ncbi:MAG: DNA polymerase III subunit alpha [bacterium]|nr:DNA polymerase III subunit alpha [bacterium]
MADLGRFIHLHVHSAYSTLDGSCQLKPLVARVKELGMGAVAVTDHGNLFGAYHFQKTCEGTDVKPILGAEMYLSPTTRQDRTSPQARTRLHCLLLCENLEGYRNLSRLSSKAYIEGHYYKPRIDLELLEQHHAGLIATSACLQGPICQAILGGSPGEAEKLVDRFVQIFGAGNYYLELMDHGIAEQKRANEGLLRIHKRLGVPVIATNDCHYLTARDHDAHDVLLCIQTGKTLDDPERMRFDEKEFYLKSPEEMIALWGHVPGAIENTVAIAERCDCAIPTRQKLLPRYRVPDGRPAAEYLRGLVERGLRARYGDSLGQTQRERAQYELGVIDSMGFVDYFLVVWDFINWARNQSIPVGPGRGSGAGSIVAYCLGITNLEPLAHGLLFERFLNPERVSMPDFDIDFCFERRGEVIEYVRSKYGAECVSQIITFGTMKARNSIRDVGRVMGMELSKVDRIAKLVPGGPKVTLKAVLGEDPDHRDMESAELKELCQGDPEVRELIERARGVEGAIRQPGTHAAGVVISDQPLIDHIPLYKPSEEGAMIATQYTMTEVEEIGLLKMDFLGLKNLTLIDKCLKTVNERFYLQLTPDKIPLEDEKTYKLLQAGKGMGLFQFESAGMRQLLTEFKPTKFSDLAVITSLYRPGPMASIPEFIKITYEHPCLEPILSETYGMFVYQEQVMLVAQVMAGYSLGGADILRKAMGKKKVEEMAKQRHIFIEGAKRNGIDEDVATRVFDTMEKFAEYGFNKSHAAAYSVISVQTAWLKAHYPVDFYSALITNEIGGEDAKIAQYFAEAREEGIAIRQPDINTSSVFFTPDGESIRFGLAAIKGVGEAAISAILEERREGGPFRSLQDFVARCDKKYLNIRTVECLVKCGAFDSLGHNRPSLLAVLPRLMELAGTARKSDDDSQTSLFDMMNEDQAAGLRAEIPIPRLPDWSDKQRLDTEKELAGFYLSGHPLERFEPDFAAFSTATAAQAADLRKGEEIEWVGLITRLVPRVDKNGRMFAFVECEDMTGTIECTLFSDVFARCREVLREGEVIWVRGRIDHYRDTNKILVNEAKAIDVVRAERIRAIEVQVPWRAVSEATLTRLREIIVRHKGRRRLWILLRDGEGELRVEAGNGHGIAPCTPLIRELQDAEPVSALRFVPRPSRNGGPDDED